MIKLRVNIDPLESTERRKKFAIVEPGRSCHWVVSRCPHHGRLHHGLRLVIIIIVLDVVPDPEGSGVEGAEIVADHELFAVFVVSIHGFLVGLGESPVERLLVDVCASVADFIGLVEVCVLVTGFDLDRLSGHEFGFHFDSTDFEFTSVECVKSVVEVLCHSDGLKHASCIA